MSNVYDSATTREEATGQAFKLLRDIVSQHRKTRGRLVPFATVMSGLPGSGKSTIAGSLLGSNIFHEPVILSSDMWIEEWAKDNDLTYNDAWEVDIVRSQASDWYRGQVARFTELSSYDVILDRTHLSAASVGRDCELVKGRDYVFLGFAVIPLIETVIAQNVGRNGKTVSEGVLRRRLDESEPYPKRFSGLNNYVGIREIEPGAWISL